MNKTKIEWCDSTWNPVTGCKHDCPYCYARRISARYGGWTTGGKKITANFGKAPAELKDPLLLEHSDGKVTVAPYPFGFEPTFHRYRLDEPARKTKGQTIFVCSMADLFGKWVHQVDRRGPGRLPESPSASLPVPHEEPGAVHGTGTPGPAAP